MSDAVKGKGPENQTRAASVNEHFARIANEASTRAGSGDDELKRKIFRGFEETINSFVSRTCEEKKNKTKLRLIKPEDNIRPRMRPRELFMRLSQISNPRTLSGDYSDISKEEKDDAMRPFLALSQCIWQTYQHERKNLPKSAPRVLFFRWRKIFATDKYPNPDFSELLKENEYTNPEYMKGIVFQFDM